MSGDNWGPWIGWNGGECPVDGDAVVDIVWHGSSGVVVSSDYANFIGWGGYDKGGKKYFISAYRVKKEPVVEVRNEVVNVGCGLEQYCTYAQCTYTDGKLTKIHWEAE